MRKQRQQIRNNSERIPSIHSSAFPAAAFAAPTFAAASTVFAAEFADGQKQISDRIHVYEYAGEYDDFVFKTLRKTTPNAEKACQ